MTQVEETPHAPLSQRFAALLLAFALAFSLGLGGCATSSDTGSVDSASTSSTSSNAGSATLSIADIPEYTGDLIIQVNGNEPGFSDSDRTRGAFEEFSDLDFEGRCGVAFARIGTDTVTTAERADISSIHPSGWEQHSYSFVDRNMLYNRSHLIAHSLCGQDIAENLITGTRTFNSVGMLYYEDIIYDYVHDTGSHVLYRVTPLFAANDLVCRGVQMEAESIEDNGAGVRFNVFVYNVEPGVEIDYATGKNWESSDTPALKSAGPAVACSATENLSSNSSSSSTSQSGTTSNASPSETSRSSNSSNSPSSSKSSNDEAASTGSSSSSGSSSNQATYVLNTKNKKFHLPTCSSVNAMSNSNKQEYTGTREALIEQGYSPCQQCNP